MQYAVAGAGRGAEQCRRARADLRLVTRSYNEITSWRGLEASLLSAKNSTESCDKSRTLTGVP
jgi:hypothetical protein